MFFDASSVGCMCCMIEGTMEKLRACTACAEKITHTAVAAQQAPPISKLGTRPKLYRPDDARLRMRMAALCSHHFWLSLWALWVTIAGCPGAQDETTGQRRRPKNAQCHTCERIHDSMASVSICANRLIGPAPYGSSVASDGMEQQQQQQRQPYVFRPGSGSIARPAYISGPDRFCTAVTCFRRRESEAQEEQ